DERGGSHGMRVGQRGSIRRPRDDALRYRASGWRRCTAQRPRSGAVRGPRRERRGTSRWKLWWALRGWYFRFKLGSETRGPMLEQKISDMFGDEDPTGFGTGWWSGVLWGLFGVLAFGAGGCLQFPQMLVSTAILAP